MGLIRAVHEMGHTLGFRDEHQRPYAGIVWDEQAVYAVPEPGDWTLMASLDTGTGAHERLDPKTIQDILVVCDYTLS